MKKCPKCGAMSFVVTAHVIQDWIVDENEDFVETVIDCRDVTHWPDDDDIWECNKCHYDAPGREFNVLGDISGFRKTNSSCINGEEE